MNTAVVSALAVGLMISAAGTTQAAASNNGTQAVPMRVAANDTDKRVVKEKRNGTEVRRTVNERPNGSEVRRTVKERPNGTVVNRTARERQNGNTVVRKAVRAPRRFRARRPWIAPRGFTYRRFTLGERVPSVLLAATYFLTNYALYGLAPPPAGYIWIREGSDAVLVDRYTGEVVQVEYDIFY